MYCNISQKTSQRVKKLCKEQKSITLFHYYYYDLLQYTHSEKCNQFVLYNKNSNGLLKDYEFVKKEKQVCWRGIDAICVCVLYSNRSRSTPMKSLWFLLAGCAVEYIFYMRMHSRTHAANDVPKRTRLGYEMQIRTWFTE